MVRAHLTLCWTPLGRVLHGVPHPPCTNIRGKGKMNGVSATILRGVSGIPGVLDVDVTLLLLAHDYHTP